MFVCGQGSELYRHEGSSSEQLNLVDDPRYAAVVRSLSQRLRAGPTTGGGWGLARLKSDDVGSRGALATVLAVALSVVARPAPSLACSMGYDWGDAKGANATSIASTLVWEKADVTDVYLATQFCTGCACGYFGGQL